MDGKQLGGIIIATIGILVGLALLTGQIAPSVGLMTGTRTLHNTTVTMPAAAGVLDLTGQELITEISVTNATDGTAVDSTNYTIAEGISATTSYKRVILTSVAGPYEGESINISYTFGEEGYVDSSGGRAFASMIIIFVSLYIMVVSLRPVLESAGVFNLFRS